MKIKITAIIFFYIALTSCSDGDKYKLHKFYKNPLSPAAVIMGGTYAGIVEKFDTIEACMISKRQAEDEIKKFVFAPHYTFTEMISKRQTEDKFKAIGYTVSKFRCSKNSKEHYMEIYNDK